MPSRSRSTAALAVTGATLLLGLLWIDAGGAGRGELAADVARGPGDDGSLAGGASTRLARPGAADTTGDRQASPDRKAEREAARVAAVIAARTASIEIVVRSRGSGQPIPGASAWVVDSSFRRKTCDDTGRVTFAVVPGRTLVGGEPPPRSEFLELPYDPVTDEPASDTAVELVEGEHGSIDVTLFPAATLRGYVTESDGEPRPHLGFILLTHDGRRWVHPRRIHTDAAGRFEVTLLERGKYLVGPDPEHPHIFPLEEVSLEWGETRELAIELAPSALVTLRVEATQKGTDAPWPFPFVIDVVRADGLGDLGRERRRDNRAVRRGRSPLKYEFMARPGPYLVSVRFLPRRIQHKLWVHQEWNISEIVTVADAFDEIKLDVEAPHLGPLAHVEGYLSRDFADPGSALWVRFAGTEHTNYWIAPRRNDKRFDIWVDLAFVPATALEFIEVRNGRETKLATIAILEGTQQVSITPRAD